jgi:hypothetical protein
MITEQNRVCACVTVEQKEAWWRAGWRTLPCLCPGLHQGVINISSCVLALDSSQSRLPQYPQVTASGQNGMFRGGLKTGESGGLIS